MMAHSRKNSCFLAIIWVATLVSTRVCGEDWPGHRGLKRDGVSPEKGLAKTWPKNGPKLLWTLDKAGAGFGGPAVLGGYVFLMGTVGKEEVLHKFGPNGALEWSSPIGPIYDFQGNNWSGGPNATPTVGKGMVFCAGSQGIVAAFDAESGKLVWKIDTVAKLGAEINPIGGGPAKKGWGFCGSPLLDEGKLIVATGGQGGLITALSPASGNVLWRSVQVKDQATYGSTMVVDCLGMQVYVVATQSGAVGVSAKDGALVWRYQRETEYPDIVACTPVCVQGKILLPVGHGGDCAMLGFEAGGPNGGVKVTPAWVAKEISNNHGGFVVQGERVIGFHAKRAWTAQNLSDGKVVWSGRRNAIGSGNAILVDDKLIALAEDTGDVALIDGLGNSYKELGRFMLPKESTIRKSGGRRWTHPVVSDGKLYIRDQELLYCYDLR